MHNNLTLVLIMLISASSFGTVLSLNPIHSVLFLIVTFVNSSFLMIILGLDFLGLSLIIIYIGAVAILFLFIIMLISFKELEFSENIFRYSPFGFIVFFNIYINFYPYFQTTKSSILNNNFQDWTSISNGILIRKIGEILYSEHFLSFYIIGNILLLSIFIVIYLGNLKTKVKNQDLFNQIYW